MNVQRQCTYCGSPLDPGAQICANCGRQVPPDAQAANQPAVAPPNGKRGALTWLLVAGVGCILVVGACLLVGVGFFILRGQGITLLPAQATQVSGLAATATNSLPLVLPSLEPLDTATPIPVPTDQPNLLPTQAPPQDTGGLTGNQRRDELSIFDDFSSKALQWPEYDDGVTIIQYEDGAYSFQVADTEYYDWVFAPVDFYPNSIEFDVWGLPGHQDGTFGVMCQFQDADNYYYVEFDLEYQQVVFGKAVNGEYSYLTKPDSQGEYWLSAEALKPSPEDVNRISFKCSQNSMMLAVNEQPLYTTTIDEPLLPEGEMTFFVYANSEAGPQGYKVFFDNVLVQSITE